MISGIFYGGSGLGNQLHRYVVTRCIAKEKGFTFGMLNPENFKGSSFLNLDMGISIKDGDLVQTFQEERIDNENGVDIRPYDEKVKNIKNNTLIDGEFQDEKYWSKYEEDVREWLKTEPLKVKDNECVIGFRGGEYQYFPDLFLPITYWNNAMDNMKKIRPDMTFRVVTDDPALAKLFFPSLPISHEIGHDWRSIRYARYLIIANSSFFIFPAWLNEECKKIIAPLHWARHNIGIWALPQNVYKHFTYQDKEGNLTMGMDLK